MTVESVSDFFFRAASRSVALFKKNTFLSVIDDAESADGEHGGAAGRAGGWDHHHPGAGQKPGSGVLFFSLFVLHILTLSLTQSVTHGCNYFFYFDQKQFSFVQK